MRDQFMNFYKEWLLCLSIMLCLVTLVGCQEIKDIIPDEQIDIQTEEPANNINMEDELTSNESEKETNGDIGADDDSPYWVDEPIFINSYADIDLNDFLDNPKLSAQENEEIKRKIIDFILYVWGYEVDYNDVLSAIDENDSDGWFDWPDMYSALYEDCYNMVDLVQLFRKPSLDYRLYSIDANFMVKPYTEYAAQNGVPIDGEYLFILVPIYITYIPSGVEEGNRTSYYVDLKKINGAYKIIGVSIDA